MEKRVKLNTELDLLRKITRVNIDREHYLLMLHDEKVFKKNKK